MRASGPAVLWDLDCTVVDSLELLYQAYRHALRVVLGRDLAREQLRHDLGPPLPLHMRRYSPEHAERLVEVFRAFYDRHHDRYARVHDGVAQVLYAGRERGWRQAVVTSRGAINTHCRLRSMGLLDLFDAVVVAEDTQQPKPHPAPVLVALDRLGATPAEAFLVGDDVVDMRAARAAGVVSVAATWGAPDIEGLLSAQPDHVARRPADLLEII